VRRRAARVYKNDAEPDSAVSRDRQGVDELGRGRPMLWTIFVILVILWLLGFSFNIGGGLIHLLLVIAVIVLIYNLIARRRG
jgi:hypothetical protein